MYGGVPLAVTALAAPAAGPPGPTNLEVTVTPLPSAWTARPVHATDGGWTVVPLN